MFDPDSIVRALSEGDTIKRPPVHLWNPASVQDIGMRIARDGTWYYQGSAIRRMSMVNLFASILRRDGEKYFLVTPHEKVSVDVELAPFIAVKMDRITESGAPALAFQTNTGDVVVADRDHLLWVDQDQRGPVPLVHVRDQLNALLSRSVFFELADSAELRVENGREYLVVTSRGHEYVLGSVDDQDC